MATGPAGGSANIGSFSKNFTEMMATAVEQQDAKNAVPMICVGFFAPAAARIATVVAGINCTEAVLIARKVHIALLAVPGRGLSFSRSCIARSPSGVAALLRPSMFAAMFMTIVPIAGCVAGTSGKSHFSTGRSARARISTRPDFSASFISPSHSAITPASGSAIVITAVLHASKAAFDTSCKCPENPPMSTASTTRPSQMKFNIRAGWADSTGKSTAGPLQDQIPRDSPSN